MRAGGLLVALAATVLVGACAANEVVVQNPTTPDVSGSSASPRDVPSLVITIDPTGSSTRRPPATSAAPPATRSLPRPGSGAPTAPRPSPAPSAARETVDLTFGEVVAGTAVEQEVAAVWRRYWVVRATAYTTNEVDDGALRAVASGAALDQIVSDVSINRAAGKRLVGRIVVAAPALAVTQTRAEVTTCVTADARLIRDDGSTVDRLADLKPQVATLELTGTTWRMVSVVERADVDCP